ncbi:hypothetical protein [Streptomyces sp. NL15-2K]|uniref:hypothetical protein n=1 Tax=Streptomyces sp. NL15-2K TaxID=376149 RepID=UPI00209BC5CA|nr:hypothetical protein [Streptomyces sp. NL15-2K]
MAVNTGQAFALADQPKSATRAAKPKTATTAADIPSARVAARLSGHRVEALSERSETSTTWVNKNGTLTTELAAAPVRFQRTGQWTDVDVTLRGTKHGAESAAHPLGLQLGGKAAGTSSPLVTVGSDQKVALGWQGTLPKPKLSGAKALFVDVSQGTDISVTATRTGFEQSMVIKERPQSADFSYTLPLDVSGLNAKQLPDGSLLFTAEKSQRWAVMSAPVMVDAAVDPVSGEPARRVPVAMKLAGKGKSARLVFRPDAKMLVDRDTKFPVTVSTAFSAQAQPAEAVAQRGVSGNRSAGLDTRSR